MKTIRASQLRKGDLIFHDGVALRVNMLDAFEALAIPGSRVHFPAVMMLRFDGERHLSLEPHEKVKLLERSKR